MVLNFLEIHKREDNLQLLKRGLNVNSAKTCANKRCSFCVAHENVKLIYKGGQDGPNGYDVREVDNQFESSIP